MWKGKARATESESDFSDLAPVITYRHLLSQTLGVKDPLRSIALCDMDAFYASCEMVRLKVDPSKPLVVAQWDSLIAINYPARPFGISRMDKVKDALKRCPELIVVHVATYKEGDPEPAYHDDPDSKTHKVSLDHYRRESQRINKMFKECLPAGAEIGGPPFLPFVYRAVADGNKEERASIDESFIDFTRPVRERLLERYPFLTEVPPEGAETPLPPPPPICWDGLGNVIPVNPDTEPSDTEATLPAGEEDQEDAASQPTWHDVALSIAAELMQTARDVIREQLGYSTSAGVARNKFLAKLAASYRKGNNQSIVRNAAIPNYLQPMAFQKIRMLGGKLGIAIAKEYEVSTVAELLPISLDEMQHKFGEESIWVYEVIRGIDRSEVKEKPSMTKSMGASKNLPTAIMKPSQGASWLRVLAAELSLRLKEARDISPNLWPKVIALGVRQGWNSHRSKQAPFPFVREVTTDIVAAAGDKLWREMFGTSDSKHPEINVTHLSLRFGGIASGEINQHGIEGFLSAKPMSTTSGKLKRKADDESDLDQQETGWPSHDEMMDEARENIDFVTCKRCKQWIKLPEHLDGPGISDDVKRDALAILCAEHSDFHFAMDLSKASKDVSVAKPGKSKKKKKGEPEGIAKFFTKKSN